MTARLIFGIGPIGDVVPKPEDKLDAVAKGFEDPVFFCQHYFPHLFPTRMPWVHKGILAILLRKTDFLWNYPEDLAKILTNFVYALDPGKEDSPVAPIFIIQGGEDGKPPRIDMVLGKFTLIKLPRGFSKTTLCGIAVPLYKVLYETIEFGAYVSESGTHARMQLENQKRELETNERIRADFGGLKPGHNDPEKWAADQYEALNGVSWIARGRGSQIRGLLHRGQRPGDIIVDDVEDKESVKTDEQRLKAREWAYGDLMPAIAELRSDSTITAIGTLLHPEALLQTWSRDPEWTVIEFGAHDRQGELLWAWNMDDEKLERKKQSFAAAGLLHVFYMEYYNKARAAETQIFKLEYIRYELPPKQEEMRTAIYCDPAIAETVEACEACLTVCGMSRKGQIFLLDETARVGMTPRDLVDEYFRLAMLWGCQMHGCESNAYQAALIHLIREEMFRKHYYFEITPVTHSTKKFERIRGVLQPRYAAGYMTHARRFPVTETQLLDFPMGKNDRIDALAGCVALLDPWAAQAAGRKKSLHENSFKPLAEVLPRWRRV